jgi:hypothetical protein
MGLELGKQRVFLVGRELVARRVGDHRHAPGLGDPAHRVAQRRPAVRHIAGLAFDQVFAKHLAVSRHTPGFNQKACKVGARNQFGVAHELQGALVGAVDAHLRQLRRHFARAPAAAAPGGGQALRELRVVGIEPQAHDVHGGVGKADGDFRAREVSHALAAGGGGGAVLAADLVVVGQGPQLDPVGLGARGQFLGRQVPSDTTEWQCRSALRRRRPRPAGPPCRCPMRRATARAADDGAAAPPAGRLRCAVPSARPGGAVPDARRPARR